LNGKPESDELSRRPDSWGSETESVDLDDPLLKELAQAPALPTEAPEAIGPYRLLEPLGKGGMGLVYRARHSDTGEIVALKTVRVPNQKMLASIRREIHTLAGMRHPGIVRIVAEGLHQGLPWYAMELLEGMTLRQYGSAVRRSRMTEASTFPAGRRGALEWWTQSMPAEPQPTDGRDLSLELPRDPAVPAAPGSGLAGASPLRLVLTLVRRICAPLAYLHGEGLVHRDLKPENILIVAASGERRAASSNTSGSSWLAARCSLLAAPAWPVLVDFGLASQYSGELSRDVLQVEGGVMGTAQYMAPEQIKGDRVDARADLYALGCILYELATGRPPFVAERPEELLRQHLQQPPQAPSQLVEGLPEELEALMLRLLAKNPEERLGYAEDVAAALGRLGAEDEPAPSGPKPRPYLYRPRFTGRSAPLEALGEALSRAAAGQGGLALVSGESGVGKTRLLMEFGQQAAHRNGIVLSGECLEMRGGSLEALRGPLHTLADRCRERGREESERLFGLHGRLLARYEPAISGLPGQEEQPEPAELPADAARLRLFRALARTFCAAAEEPPLVLMLDDLQWADELTVGFLDHVLRAGHLEQMGWLIVGAARTEELGPALAKLREARGVKGLGLGRLREEELKAMVGDMLALDPPPQAFVRFLLEQSEGNPFFVGEYLRTAVSEGLLNRDELGRWQVAEPESRESGFGSRDSGFGEPGALLTRLPTPDEQTHFVGAPRRPTPGYEALPLPGSIQQLVGRRLAGLSAAARHLVDAAAVVGREAAAPLVWGIAGLGTSELLEASAEVLRRQVLEEVGGGALRFLHDKLREVAYESLTPSQRRALHRAAATQVETLFGEASEERAAELGHHWEQAEETAKARGYYLAGARRARDRYAFDEAERLYRAFLRLVEDPAAGAPATEESLRASLGVRSELAMGVLEPRGRYEEAKAESRHALALSRQVADRASEGRILGDLAKLNCVQGHMEEARRLFEEALGILSGAGASASGRQTEAHILDEFAILHHMQGHVGEAEALYRQALDLFSGGAPSTRGLPRSGDRRGEGRTLGHLAIFYHEQGRIDEAKALYERALGILREVGDRRGEGSILGNLANLRRKQGFYDEALTLYQQALAVKREVDDREGEGFNLGNLANLHRMQERPDEALASYEQSLAVAREVGNRRLEGIVLGNLAGLQLELGRPAEAQVLYQKALAIIRELGDQPGEGILLCYLANLEREAEGRFEEAERLVTKAEAILREVNDSLHLAVGFCEHGHLELARGRSGREWLDRALQISASLDLRSESEIAKATDGLRRAQEAFEAGGTRRLFHGKLLEDVPEGLRRWLAGTSPA
jgi:serine/threonine protein kinase/tetratricopeptide (TPR) repeat protein